MHIEKLDLQSPDLVNDNFEKLAALFPNCVTESDNGKAIDFDLLKQELNHAVVEGNKERYRLEWPGKRQAIVTANLPTNKTLRPIREDSVNFDKTENIYIEGDNLEVLKLLQESYLGKIKMIYIDPPYNTGNDFVYNDNFKGDSEKELSDSGQKDELKNRLVVNPETAGRYHSDWLTMMYPRLKLARNLLKDDGVIFISIDDNEVHNLKKICDEIFGDNNFQGIFTVNSTPNARDYGHIGKMQEYVLFYSKDNIMCLTNQLLEIDKNFKYEDTDGGFNIHPLYNSNEAFHSKNRPNLYYPFYLDPNKKTEEDFFQISLKYNDGMIEVYPPKSVKNNVQFVWRWGKEKSQQNLNHEIVGYKTGDEYRIVQKMRHTSKLIRSLLIDKKYSSRKGTAEVEELFGSKIFSFPKPLSLIQDFINVGTNDNDILLDFFSGSSSTAHAVIQINAEVNTKRKYIMVQLPEATDERSEAYNVGYKNICEIGKERIRKASRLIIKGIKKEIATLESQLKKARENLTQENALMVKTLDRIETLTEEIETIESNIAEKQNILANLDTGFRVYRLDESNMEDVYYKPQEIEQGKLDLMTDNVKLDRTGDDLLTQVMLSWGIPLSMPMEEGVILGKKVFKVAGNSLYACFDKGIDDAFAKEIAKDEPLRIVFRDNSFVDDTAKINVKQLLKQLSPNTEMKVI